MRNLLLIALTVLQAIIPVLIRKVVVQEKICNTKKSVCLTHPRRSENHTARNLIHLGNGLRKRHSKLREIVILAGKTYLNITLLVKTPLHQNKEVARSDY